MKKSTLNRNQYKREVWREEHVCTCDHTAIWWQLILPQPPGMLRERSLCVCVCVRAISKTKCLKDWTIERLNGLKTHSIYNWNFSNHSVRQAKRLDAFFSIVQFLHFILNELNGIENRFEKKRVHHLSLLPARLPNQKLYFFDYLHSLMKLCPNKWWNRPKDWTDRDGSGVTKAIQLCDGDADVHIFGELPFFSSTMKIVNNSVFLCACVFSFWWFLPLLPKPHP